MAKLRNELLKREISDRINEASVVLGFWRREYNQYWLHNSLEYRSLVPKAFEGANLTWQMID